MSKIYRYIWISGGTGRTNIVHSTFLAKKKVLEHDLYLNQILHQFVLKKILGWIIKILRQGGARGPPLLFLYEVGIVVLINFISILVTPGIFLIQLVKTNITNMYLIHFHSKNNIQMRFPKSWVFKVSNPLQTFIISRNAVK